MAALVKLPQWPPLRVAVVVGPSLFCPLLSCVAVDSFGKPACPSAASPVSTTTRPTSGVRPRLAATSRRLCAPLVPRTRYTRRGCARAAERLLPQHFTCEIALHEVIRGGGDHQCIRRRNLLQPRRNIRRLSQRQGLVAVSCPNVAHHDHAGMHPEPHSDPLPRG